MDGLARESVLRKYLAILLERLRETAKNIKVVGDAAGIRALYFPNAVQALLLHLSCRVYRVL